MRQELEKVRAWADEKVANGQEPPWAWFQYMKLRETLDMILAGMDTIITENSRQLVDRPRRHLQLIDSAALPDNSPRRLADLPVRLPT